MSQNRYDLPSAIYRVPQRDRSGQRMLLIGAAIIGVGAVVGGGLWLLNGGTRMGEIPVIEADHRPMRERPENPGGMQVEGQDDMILSGRGAGGQGRETLAPRAERPMRPPAPTPPPAVEHPPAQAQVAPPAAQPQPEAQAAASAPAATPRTATPTPAPTAQAPAPAAPTPAAAPAPPRAEPTPPAATGRASVQFGAMASEEAARGEWQRLQRAMPDLLGGRQASVSRIERDGRAMYRLRTGGFADTDAAKTFCDRVRAAGGSCLVPAS